MRNRIATTLALSALSLIPAASAFADHPGDPVEPGDEIPSSVERSLGGDVEITQNGLYRVDIGQGPDLLTHGPDTEAQIEAEAAAAGQSAQFGAGSPERAVDCTLSREATERFQTVIYARPATSPDRRTESIPTIRTQMRRMNWVLNRDSLASGGPTADYRVGCNFPLSDQQIFVGNLTTNGSTYAEIVASAKAAGWIDYRADFTIFFDGEDPTGLACGIGNIWNDDSLSANNRNNNPDIAGATGDYGVTYRSCWNGNTVMHENGHNSGAVQNTAPHATGQGGWHCWDEQDIMCYSPDGGTNHQEGTETLCSDREYFDCGFDDYFDANPESGEYLATHWNMGSSLNKMIRFGGTGGATPEADFNVSCVETACQFQNTSTDDAGVVESAWAFGYGAGSGQASPAHTFPGPGTYQVQLQVRDDRQSWDSITKPVTVTEGVQALTSGAAFSDTIGARGTLKRYLIRVPSGSSQLTVSLDGSDCRFLSGPQCEPNLDLYARRGADPTRTEFDCRKRSKTTSDEVCTINAPRRGKWLIGVDNAFATPGSQFAVTATVAP
ncbi:MAG: PKD domain-containing protein [Solirubrobacterales bacterium]